MTDRAALLMASLDAVQDEIVLVIDENANICFGNDAYYETIGFTREESLGKPLLDWRPNAKIVGVLQHKEKELRVIRKGDMDDVLCNLYPVVIDEQIVGAVSISRTINEVLSSADFVHKYYNASDLGIHKMRTPQIETTFEDIIAADESSRKSIEIAKKIAPKNIDILLVGESGVGKERYAQAIHSASKRRDRNFVAINCATLHDNLLESELFGYEEGSFTGAKRGGKPGIFEIANGGTVFLDEISELDYQVQSRLLRVLQERRVRRIGGTSESEINVRVIAATNTSLEDRLESGHFRKDLYYRIAPFVLDIPPLRKRSGDILPMVRRFLVKHENEVLGRIDVSTDAKEALLQYNWDGNVRELQNAIEHATAIMDGTTIEWTDLPKKIQDAYGKLKKGNRTLKERTAEFERREIKKTLALFEDNTDGRRLAAEQLDISMSSFYKKLNAK